MNTNHHSPEKPEKIEPNPYKDMGFFQFWAVSTLFWMSFPLSFFICYFALGSLRTKQLIKALVHDFLQTIFILLAVACAVIYLLYHVISGWF